MLPFDPTPYRRKNVGSQGEMLTQVDKVLTAKCQIGCVRSDLVSDHFLVKDKVEEFVKVAVHKNAYLPGGISLFRGAPWTFRTRMSPRRKINRRRKIAPRHNTST